MAENNVSPAQSSRDLSASRLIARQTEKQDERQSHVIARQQNSQKVRAKSIVETQTGRKVNIRV